MKWLRKSKNTPWDWLRSNHEDLARSLDRIFDFPETTEVDRARILDAVNRAANEPQQLTELAKEFQTEGAGSLVHFSGKRTLQGSRFTLHNLQTGQVRLGRVVPDDRSGSNYGGDFGLDLDTLRTSLLVIGPPGSGKTRSFAIPIVEHLSLAALANKASVLVVDPKGTDFHFDGWFDITIDPLSPTHGLSLFGGSSSPDMAADRLAAALLPPEVSDDKTYFMDASRNALYACLAPHVHATGRWPTVSELLSLLRGQQSAMDKVKSGLKGADGKHWKDLLDSHAGRASHRSAPAASMVERLGLLDRPTLHELLDRRDPKLDMHEINRPTRIRVVLPEAEFPDASRILARLVISQFIQVTSSAGTNRDIFKALVVDEAGRFVDDYVARGVQRVRSNNAGLVLLSQSLLDFPPEVLGTVFGSMGCKAVFGGIAPQDAQVFSEWFGDHHVQDVSFSRGERKGVSFDDDGRRNVQTGETRSVTARRYERRRWSVSDLINDLPTGNCVATLSRSTGERAGPYKVDPRT